MRGGETETQRDRETERETQRERQRQRQRETDTEREGRKEGERGGEGERERAIINQTSIGTVLNATLGKLLRDGMERIIMGFSKRINTILN